MTYKNMLLMAGCALFSATAKAQVTIDIDAQQRGPKVSPILYGIFYEDINHAADGGIYAELIRNRSFEDGPRYGAPADMQGWTTYAAAPSQLTARLIQPTKKTPLLNSVQHNALALDIKASAALPVCLVTGTQLSSVVLGKDSEIPGHRKGHTLLEGRLTTLCRDVGQRISCRQGQGLDEV